MGLRLRTFALLAGVSMLAGCGAFEATTIYNNAEGTTPQGDAYHQALYEAYMEHADYEYNEMMDYKDAIYHSNKALAAAGNQTPPIGSVSERNEPADKIDELTQGRARLVSALDGGAAGERPTEAAKAQGYYDCWLEQQEENFQPRDIAYCRDGFYSNLASIEPQQAGMGEVITLAADVFFDFDRDTLKPEFLPELDRVAEMLVQDSNVRVRVEGHTDTAGPPEYNEGLSVRRAEAVAEYLEDQGVTRDRMTVEGFGETRLKVQTPDDTPNAENRRTEIRRR